MKVRKYAHLLMICLILAINQNAISQCTNQVKEGCLIFSLNYHGGGRICIRIGEDNFESLVAEQKFIGFLSEYQNANEQFIDFCGIDIYTPGNLKSFIGTLGPDNCKIEITGCCIKYGNLNENISLQYLYKNNEYFGMTLAKLRTTIENYSCN